MAGNLLAKYGASNQTITITVASLANNTARQSTAIDNSSNLFLDALVFLKIKSAAASTSATGYCNIYAAASADGGTTYTENAGASDAAITLTVPPNARLIGTINMVANAVTYYSGPMSVAQAFGGTMPDHWLIILENKTGGTLDATGGSHAVFFQGVMGSYT